MNSMVNPEQSNQQPIALPTSADFMRDYMNMHVPEYGSKSRGGYLNGRLSHDADNPFKEQPPETEPSLEDELFMYDDSAVPSLEAETVTGTVPRRQRVARFISGLYHTAGVQVTNALSGLGETMQASDEQSRRRRVKVAAFATVVGAGALYVGGAELMQHAHHSGVSATNALPAPKPQPGFNALLPDLHSHMHANTPANHSANQLPIPSRSTPKIPATPVHHTAVSQQASTITEKFTHHGDTIDSSLRQVEPRTLTTRQHNWLLHKVMGYNHRSDASARHMRVGQTIRIPRFLLNRNYIARHSR